MEHTVGGLFGSDEEQHRQVGQDFRQHQSVQIGYQQGLALGQCQTDEQEGIRAEKNFQQKDQTKRTEKQKYKRSNHRQMEKKETK